MAQHCLKAEEYTMRPKVSQFFQSQLDTTGLFTANKFLTVMNLLQLFIHSTNVYWVPSKHSGTVLRTWWSLIKTSPTTWALHPNGDTH